MLGQLRNYKGKYVGIIVGTVGTSGLLYHVLCYNCQNEPYKLQIFSILIFRISSINMNINNQVLSNEQIEMSAKQKREANLGYVLVSISVLFIICQSFKIIPGTYLLQIPEY